MSSVSAKSLYKSTVAHEVMLHTVIHPLVPVLHLKYKATLPNVTNNL